MAADEGEIEGGGAVHCRTLRGSHASEKSDVDEGKSWGHIGSWPLNKALSALERRGIVVCGEESRIRLKEYASCCLRLAQTIRSMDIGGELHGELTLTFPSLRCSFVRRENL